MSGKTDIDIEISNQCGRLIANAIIYYNSAILSRLLDKYQTTESSKALALSQKNLAGRLAAYPFSRSLYLLRQQTSDRSHAMVANLTLQEDEQGLPANVNPIRSGPEMSWETA